MAIRVDIENIEEMRLEQGIDDVELRKEIGALQIGDLVKLTLLTGRQKSVSETLLFRITNRNGISFMGELASRPTAGPLCTFAIGSSFAFSADHIHSVHHLPNVLAEG